LATLPTGAFAAAAQTQAINPGIYFRAQSPPGVARTVKRYYGLLVLWVAIMIPVAYIDRKIVYRFRGLVLTWARFSTI
jgi:hypothetical protein